MPIPFAANHTNHYAEEFQRRLTYRKHAARCQVQLNYSPIDKPREITRCTQATSEATTPPASVIVMPRPRALVRQWTLLRILSQHPNGLSIDDMAYQAAVNNRTVRRDLKLFINAGIPLRESIGSRNRKTWRIDQQNTRVLGLNSAQDYLVLNLAATLLKPLQETEFYRTLCSMRDQVAGAVNSPVRRCIDQVIQQAIQESPMDPPGELRRDCNVTLKLLETAFASLTAMLAHANTANAAVAPACQLSGSTNPAQQAGSID